MGVPGGDNPQQILLRVVHILLECILVFYAVVVNITPNGQTSNGNWRDQCESGGTTASQWEPRNVKTFIQTSNNLKLAAIQLVMSYSTFHVVDLLCT